MSEPMLDVAALTALLRNAPQQALAVLRKAAIHPGAGVPLLLAQIYAEGRGITADPKQALLWYEVAANAGDADAMNHLGRCHELGFGTTCHLALAAVWYRRAAAHGSCWGMYNAAHLFASGRGVPQDQAQALALYRRAAERGHAKAMNFLARYLDEGWACPRDPLAAHGWYRRSAEAGDYRGQASYATVLADHGQIAQAERWMRQAIHGGHAGFHRQLTCLLRRCPHPRLRALRALLPTQPSAAKGETRADNTSPARLASTT